MALTNLPTSSVPLSTKNTYSISQVDIIDLTVDDDDDDENAQEQVDIFMSSTTQIKVEETQLSAGGETQRLSLSYHANNHSCAELHELLDTLSAKEREELARDVKVYKPGMKVRPFCLCLIHLILTRSQSADIISALLCNSKKQTTLSFKGKSPLRYKDRITALVMEKLGTRTTALSFTLSLQ